MPTKPKEIAECEVTPEIIEKANAYEELKKGFADLEKRIAIVLKEKEEFETKCNRLFDEIEIKDEKIELLTQEVERLSTDVQSISQGVDAMNTIGAEFDEGVYKEWCAEFLPSGIVQTAGKLPMKLVSTKINSETKILATDMVGARDRVIMSGNVGTVKNLSDQIIKDDFSKIESVTRGEIIYKKGLFPECY